MPHRTCVSIGILLSACLPLVSAGCSRGAIEARSRIPLVDCEAPGYRGTAKCGTYLVWENRTARSGRQIAINIVILPASGRSVRPDPVFYFDGGPGAAASRAAGNIGRFLRAVNESRDLVFIDARGTGRANPPPAFFPVPVEAFAIPALLLFCK